MNDDLIKILINNTYHGFLSLFSLLAFMYTTNELVGKQSVFGWVMLILLALVFVYHMLAMRKFK